MMTNLRPKIALATALSVLAALVAVAAPAYSAGHTMVVNAAATLRPVTQVASGGLYALATASNPTLALLRPLNLNQLTQPAPGVQQLGNGATVPTGDALIVAPSATNAGAQSYVRMPDIYKDFPYKWVSWSDWTSKVNTMVNARIAATGTTNINGWELWNEPDWTWDTAAAGSWTSGWATTFNAVRALDTITPIVGPSDSYYSHDRMVTFLTAAKASNTLPDVICWHELNGGTGGWGLIDEHVADYRALEISLGITPRPIAINEYAAPDQVDVPSAAAHYIAQLERSGVATADRAYWYESGTVGGLIYNGQPTGTYWLYKWYGEMAGNMVPVTAAGDLDGFAAYDSTRKIVNVVFGGDYGNNSVRIDGLSGFGTTAKVVLSYTPNSGRLANVAAPTVQSTTNYTISGGSITVPINNQDYLGAYQLVVTPQAGPTTSYQQVYEAENATIVNAASLSASSASNGGYVGRIDGSSNARNDSFVDFLTNVPTAGTYTLSVRYANGGTATATQGLAYNGGAWGSLSYPVTGAWGSFTSTVTTTVTLNAGYNMIRLAKGSPGYGGGTGYAEIDYIQVVKN
jgi:hypothetical protein